jgi:hypothetical protein
MHIEIIEKFKSYLELLNKFEESENFARNDLAAEGIERLNQLFCISNELQKIDSQFGTILMVTRTNEQGEIEHYNAAHERDEQLRFTMRLLTESYYYFAFRLRQILRNRTHPFKGLNTFECIGVRDVRNHLIEHPEGANSMIFNRTFSWTKESGMQLKTGRQVWEGDAFSDAGFIANSNEFNKILMLKLESACEMLVSEISQRSKT